MKLPSKRTQTVIQTLDFLIGLTRDTGLPDAVQQEVNWLLRHSPYPLQSATPMAGKAQTEIRGEGMWMPRVDREENRLPRIAYTQRSHLEEGAKPLLKMT